MSAWLLQLKRCVPEKLRSEIDYYLTTLGLEEKRSAYAQTLSGGQKRKLSVGIALIGDSKVSLFFRSKRSLTGQSHLLAHHTVSVYVLWLTSSSRFLPTPERLLWLKSVHQVMKRLVGF